MVGRTHHLPSIRRLSILLVAQSSHAPGLVLRQELKVKKSIKAAANPERNFPKLKNDKFKLSHSMKAIGSALDECQSNSRDLRHEECCSAA